MILATSPTTCQPTKTGSVFLLAIVILVVIFMLGASLIENAQTTVYRASVESRSAKAFHLAEAGIHKALWQLNQSNGWLTYPGESPAQLPGGSVDITVTPAPSSRGILTAHLTIVATGYLPGPNGTQRYPCTIRVITHRDSDYFRYAVFGAQEVYVGNGTTTVATDSYDSEDGGYGATNTGISGDIRTNSTAANAVTILPLGVVNGTVTVGPGASPPDACVDNKGTINGTIESAEAEALMPSITIPDGVIELGDVWLEGNQELVLDEGAYHVTDLDLFGNAQITCNGKVAIYIDQTTDAGSPDVRIGGKGIVNTSQIPTDLTLYCCDDVVSIDISGNAAVYGAIYAPKADITLNSGELYGSVIGETVRLNGANACVHYDEAFRDISDPRALMRSWEVL